MAQRRPSEGQAEGARMLTGDAQERKGRLAATGRKAAGAPGRRDGA